ncbi:MAG: hypothetical protein QOJ65_698 [Fimbriimonadaceae bacterium]|nr:hypothetical protein [Fimbriimonadaceae bacterium]
MSPLYRLDVEWFRAIHVGWHGPVQDAIFLVLSYLGLGQVLFFIAMGFLLFRKTRYYSLPLLVTVLASSILAQVPKRLIPRERPSNLAFTNPQEAWLHNSFPSGHTTSAFAFAFMMVFLTYGTKRAWAGWVSLLLACLIGISRIYRGIHWPSDVLAGAFFGCITAAVVFLILDRLGKILHLDSPEATLTGREVSESVEPVSVER